MKATWIALAVAVSAPAFAADPAKPTTPAAQAPGKAVGQPSTANTPAPPAAPMDMSKMGPWSRKPTNAGALKKEVDAFIKEEEAISNKGDFDASIAHIDFPIYMLTDDKNGKVSNVEFTKETYIQTMKPMWDQMPKDHKTSFKPTITVLSDNLAVVVSDVTMHHGKQKFSGPNAGIVVKKEGKWLWKSITEAGWGEGNMSGTGGSGESTQY
jgi:hypothetical protein